MPSTCPGARFANRTHLARPIALERAHTFYDERAALVGYSEHIYAGNLRLMSMGFPSHVSHLCSRLTRPRSDSPRQREKAQKLSHASQNRRYETR
jgi:hypothetical protein